jgi:branched-chain amino acid transport system substrate-binding protein
VLGGELEVLANYIYGEAHKKTAVILFENDAAGIAGRDDFVASYTKAGGKILAQEPINFGDTNYRPALLKLAAANADMIFVCLTAGLSPLADQLKQIDFKPAIVGNTFFNDPEVIADPNAEGWTHSQVVINAPDTMAAEFKKKFNSEFDFFPKQYYNAATIVLKCIDKVVKDGKKITGENLRDALFAIKRFEGLTTVVFNTNTAVAQININAFHDRKDTTIKVIPPK